MKNKGFTLVEMIAVITLIALLTTLALPPIMLQVNKKKQEERDALKKTVYAETDLYIKSNTIKYGKLGYKYCLSTESLVNDGYLDSSILNNDLLGSLNIVQITLDKYGKYNYDMVSTCTEGDY